ncbi:hypothetical protein EG856_01785 [Mycoplasmopsis phocirhinis]|uniref:Uncharacterized protein n=1 Tax=Mycoplasmopsis phocirhinis TaxID=142650 RepID=A0A4P6MMD2_9BACT|nr:hypothetical protein [Mycoplasmopsis phocirhinis]QBF34648.1 hypothetical protein EG856_01785 [Mycoplasmopsis phocirhinis]
MNFNILQQNIIWGSISFFLTVILILIYILIFSYSWREIISKKGLSRVFLRNQIKVNQTFFKLFFKKQKRLLIFFIISLICLIPVFSINFVFVVLIQFNSDFILNYLYVFMISGFGIIFSFVWIIIFLHASVKMLNIGKEIKNWHAKNQDNNWILFEKMNVDANKNIYNEFDNSKHLIFNIFLPLKYRFYSHTGEINFVYRHWKRRILKFKHFDDELYYFLIFNYDDIPLNNTLYKLEDYAYILQNKNKLLNNKN